MKKRVISLIIVLILAFSAVVPALASDGSLTNFKIKNTYTCGQFNDVQSYEWYAMYVQAAYEYGLIKGKSPAAYDPAQTLTIAEAIKMAACLNSIYYTGKMNFTAASPWYKPYIEYAFKKGIITSSFKDYNTYVTRSEFSDMIVRALPEKAFTGINSVKDNAIPDMLLSDSYGASVYKLYRAGVLAGCDSFGTFRPYSPLTRAEAAAVIARASNTEFRKSVSIPADLDSAQLFKKCSDAVFYIERYDSEGVLLGIGSGFFITRDGLAVTNYHVIGGASSAIITTADGVKYTVKGICGYDKNADIAILQIDGSGFSYLGIDGSDTLTVGTEVYAIGNPYGLINTISGGLISNCKQQINGSDFIQFSAPISMGSGGGPVLNTSGAVVGVTCLTALNGQTLNFAVPIHKLDDLSRTGCVPLISIVAKNADSTVYYRGYFPVPDYGVFTGTPLFKSQFDDATGIKTYYYKKSDLAVSDNTAVGGYVSLLKDNGFVWQSTYTNAGGFTVDVYYNANSDISVHFGMDNPDGVVCRFVAVC